MAVFIQRCEIKPITLVVDYKPRRVDVSAIRAGNLTEVVNMTAWSDVKITLPNIRLLGMHGWHTVGSSILQIYIQDIVTKQVSIYSSFLLASLFTKTWEYCYCFPRYKKESMFWLISTKHGIETVLHCPVLRAEHNKQHLMVSMTWTFLFLSSDFLPYLITFLVHCKWVRSNHVLSLFGWRKKETIMSSLVVSHPKHGNRSDLLLICYISGFKHSLLRET